MAGKKLWVPQPSTQLYAAGGSDPERLRDRLVDQYGEGSVQRAELSVVLDLMMLTGVINPSEFVDIMLKKLKRIDEMRRGLAQLESDGSRVHRT